MPRMIPNSGKNLALLAVLELDSYVVRLFKNDYTPDRDSLNYPVEDGTYGDFEEADFEGYDVQPTTNWSTPEINSANDAETKADLLTYVAEDDEEGQEVFGMWIETDGGELFGAERFAEAPIDMSTLGASFTLLPVISVRSQFVN